MSKWQEHRDWADSSTCGEVELSDVFYALEQVVKVLADIGEELEKANTPKMFDPSGFAAMPSNPYPDPNAHQQGCSMVKDSAGFCPCHKQSVIDQATPGETITFAAYKHDDACNTEAMPQFNGLCFCRERKRRAQL